MSDVASIDQILADAENPEFRRVVTVRVLLRQDLIARHTELDAELQEQMGHAPRVRTVESGLPTELAQRVAALEAEMDAAKVTFRFGSIGHRAWADLLAKHPAPRAEKDQYGFNRRTFPEAAVAAACIEPKMTLDDAKRLSAAVDDTTWTRLFNAAVSANAWGGSDPKSEAARLILGSNAESEPPRTTTIVPAASSSDDA